MSHRFMVRLSVGLAFLLAVLTWTWALTATPGYAADRQPTLVATFTIIEDFVRQVAGPDADVRGLTPIGAEVHEWELVPSNFVDLEQADIVFYNGYDLEQWMNQVTATVRPHVPVLAVAEQSGYATLPIVTGDYAGHPDPHLWMDPRAAAAYTATIRDALMELDPDHATRYERNAAAYISELWALHAEIIAVLAVIEPNDRTLITSEAAFVYFADAYQFHHDGIWGTNSEDEGTPQQLMRIIRTVRDRQPKALFWESTISDRYVRSVSEDTGTPIAGPLYVDSVGAAGTDGATYLDMMRANARLLAEILGP